MTIDKYIDLVSEDLYILYIRFNEEVNDETKRMAKFVTLEQAEEIIKKYTELFELIMDSPQQNDIQENGADIWTEDEILLGFESGTIYARPVFDPDRPTLFYKGEDQHTDTVWTPVDWDE
jgi:hypothetical protein